MKAERRKQIAKGESTHDLAELEPVSASSTISRLT